MAKAIEMHVAATCEDGRQIPEPSRFEVMEVAWALLLSSFPSKARSAISLSVYPDAK
jgi:hypothetical protein